MCRNHHAFRVKSHDDTKAVVNEICEDSDPRDAKECDGSFVVEVNGNEPHIKEQSYGGERETVEHNVSPDRRKL